MDTRTPEQRRRIMQAVRTKNTAPEMRVRKLLHHLGYRFRLHATDLPGTPDIVFRSRRKVIFVHGCFWHGHECPKGRAPKSGGAYWHGKLLANRERDRRVIDALMSIGWGTLTVWQCQAVDDEALGARLKHFLDP